MGKRNNYRVPTFQEIRGHKDEKVKASSYIKELSDDLRDAQQERRQLVKMLERYTCGSGSGASRDAPRPESHMGYGDDRRGDWDARARDRSRDRSGSGNLRDDWKEREAGVNLIGKDNDRIRERIDRPDRSERIVRNPAARSSRGDGDM